MFEYEIEVKMENQSYVVYRILNIVTGKSYIGITNSFKRRKKDHSYRLVIGEHHSTKLQDSFNKHGKAVFEWSIVETGLAKEGVKDAEVKWIAFFDSYNKGYNMTKGGDGRLSIPCVWNGVEYDGVTEAADALGITSGTMSQRLKKGYTCDADMTPRNIQRSIVWNEIEYPSMRAAAAACGISVSAMKARLDKGYRADTDMFSEWASFHKPRSKKVKPVVVETPKEIAGGRKPINLIALTQELKRPA